MINELSICTYHEYILEAASSLLLGLKFYEKGKLIDPIENGSDNNMEYAEINCRYSFLMISNSLEAAANAMLLSLNFNKSYYEELEKLNTLVKFKLFCSFLGKKLNEGDSRYCKIKEIIKCRNEFVHPKPKKVNLYFDKKESNMTFDIKRTESRKYSTYFYEIKPNHALTALEDTLSFLSWICFDVCNLDPLAGAFMIGCDSILNTSDIQAIGELCNIKFDMRTFAENQLTNMKHR